MENGARMILQKLPEENRQVSHSQAQPAAAKNPARVPPLPSLPQRSCAFRAAYACSPLEGLEESTGLGPGTGLGSGDTPSFPPRTHLAERLHLSTQKSLEPNPSVPPTPCPPVNHLSLSGSASPPPNPSPGATPEHPPQGIPGSASFKQLLKTKTT